MAFEKKETSLDLIAQDAAPRQPVMDGQYELASGIESQISEENVPYGQDSGALSKLVSRVAKNFSKAAGYSVRKISEGVPGVPTGIKAALFGVALTAALTACSGDTNVSRYASISDKNVPEVANYKSDSFRLGSVSAPVTIHYMTDFTHPSGAEWSQYVLGPVLEEYVATGKANISFWYLNSSNREEDILAHIGASCANEQEKFWEYHDLLFENQEKLDEKNIHSNLASELGNLNLDAYKACMSEAEEFYQGFSGQENAANHSVFSFYSMPLISISHPELTTINVETGAEHTSYASILVDNPHNFKEIEDALNDAYELSLNKRTEYTR